MSSLFVGRIGWQPVQDVVSEVRTGPN